MTNKKHYIKSVNDIKYCEENNKPIFSDLDYNYYEYHNGVWCLFDENGDVLRYYNATIDTEYTYYYKEEPEEQTEATEKDVGNLCVFKDNYGKFFVSVLRGYDKDFDLPYENFNGWYKWCRPLTKVEIQEFMEKAE